MKKPKTNRVLFLAALMALATACKKDPNGTDTPVDPTREIIIDWNWQDNLGYAPPKDTIMFYTKQKDVKWVFINLTSPNSSGYRPRAFHRARDTLQTRIDIAPLKVRGSGTIYVNSVAGAHLPNDYSNNQSGMSLEDSIWYTKNGWKIQRLNQFYSK